MVQSPAVTFSDSRFLAGLFSNASFRSLCKAGDEHNHFTQSLLDLMETSSKGRKLRDLLDSGYGQLLQDYRHEYLFKTALLNSYILKNYSLDTSILLNEFKVGKSIADVVLVNGSNKVFEIKTELDSPYRLDSQILDYKKIFSEVYLVVHEKQAERYSSFVPSEIGMLCISEDFGISENRKAEVDNSKLEIEAMVKSLRKSELTDLVLTLSGETPSATPVKLFTTCLEIVKDFPPEQVQREYLHIIKKRINSRLNARVLSDQVPDFLKFFCYTENIKEKDYIHLLDSLNINL